MANIIKALKHSQNHQNGLKHFVNTWCSFKATEKRSIKYTENGFLSHKWKLALNTKITQK